jgi:hypothetical protein
MKYKRYDPITHHYPRTLAEAFDEHPDPIELPHEPSLLRWWGELGAAIMIVLFCVFVVMAIA